MSNKQSPLEVVKRYHKIYLEYETAFNNDSFDESKLQQELKKAAEQAGSFDSKEFEDTAIDLLVERPTRRQDVTNAAIRFFLYTDFFIKTQETELPEDIKKDFKNLPIAEQLKPFYSVDSGKFVKNENTPINIERERLKELFDQLMKQG